MPTVATLKKKSRAAREKKILFPEIGFDGRTFPERLGLAIKIKGISQGQLAARSSDLLAPLRPAPELDKRGRPKKLVPQQVVNSLINGAGRTSMFGCVFAHILGVPGMWLLFGYGEDALDAEFRRQLRLHKIPPRPK